jgi:hypothetical protein
VSASGAVLVWSAAAIDAAPLPTCPPANPPEISDPKLAVNSAWQRYRTKITAEHRCCARSCEPIAYLAAKTEKNGINLYRVATNARVPAAARQEALRNANANYGARGDFIREFDNCLIATRPRVGSGGPTCGKPAADQLELLRWADWCTAFTPRQEEVDNLLRKIVGATPGTWQFSANVKIDEDDGAKYGTYDATLPPGKTAKPILDRIRKMDFKSFPDANVTSVRMDFVSRVVNVPGVSGSPFVISKVLAGPCPPKKTLF